MSNKPTVWPAAPAEDGATNSAMSRSCRIRSELRTLHLSRGLVFKSLGQIDQAFSDMMEAASLVESLGRFDMERMIIGFLTGGHAAPYDDP